MGNFKLTKFSAILALVIASIGAAPAQSLDDLIKNRQGKEDQWKNLAIGGGVLGVIGLLGKNNTLTYLGLGGGLYSYYRMEEDRKSKNKLNRQRAELFNRRSFSHKGKKYVRKTKVKNGKKYYYFARS